MSHFHFSFGYRMRATSCHGSCAVLLRAEKADGLSISSNLPTSSNLVFQRLDGCNPRWYWVRPTSQPFYRFLSRMRAHTRIRARAFPYSTFYKTENQVRKVRRLGRARAIKPFSRLTFCPTIGRLDG
jgi:hypothetical protein